MNWPNTKPAMIFSQPKNERKSQTLIFPVPFLCVLKKTREWSTCNLVAPFLNVVLKTCNSFHNSFAHEVGYLKKNGWVGHRGIAVIERRVGSVLNRKLALSR